MTNKFRKELYNMKLSFKTMEKYHIKILGLILLILGFGILYIVFDASHFHGINPLQDKIKDKIVEDEVRKGSIEGYESIEKEKIKQNIEEVVKEDEKKIENPSITQSLFDRIYFSTITACLLGYGDIYPATNTMKALAAFQSFLTVCLILY